MEVRPPSREIDLETIWPVVLGAAKVSLAPASWCWLLPAKATERISPWACSPSNASSRYFMVSLEPMLPSIHSMVAPS